MNYKNLTMVDDKYIPLYRVVWVGATPHFCGHEDCEREGQYEVRLLQEEAVWASLEDRDRVLEALDKWSDEEPPPGDENWEE
jgi:hypothetical protein